MSTDMDGLKAERDQLEREIASIKNQLEAYKLRPRSMPADDDWFRRASAALRIKALDFNQLNREICQLEKNERRLLNDSRERTFIAVSRRRLDPETYQSIWDEVDEA